MTDTPSPYQISVTKRDGSSEPFSPEKITRVAEAAGLEPDQAQKLSQQVADWAATHFTDHISTKQIRDRVVELMREVSHPAANLYVWYGTTKDQTHPYN